MMNNRNAHEVMKVVDQLQYGNRMVAGGDPHEVIGEVEIIYRSKHNGKAVFTKTIRRNDLLVTGAVYLSEKINNLRCAGYHPATLDLDTKYGSHTVDSQFTIGDSIYMMNDAGTAPFERVCGIMVGREGCGSTNNQVHRVYRTDLQVPGMIPFRTINVSDGQEDLSPDERKNYFLRKRQSINGKDCICYYGKRFLTTPEINVQWEDGTVVNIESLTPGNDRGKMVKTFTKYFTVLDAKDIREYCRILEGHTIRSLVNSVGLLTGFPIECNDSGIENGKILTPGEESVYDGSYEFGNVRGMTTLNTEDYPLKDKESTMDITYRLYFV